MGAAEPAGLGTTFRERETRMMRSEEPAAGTPAPAEASEPPAADAEPVGDQRPRPARLYPDPVDDALDDTFPASDPPSWTGGK